MRLGEFISANLEPILSEWETFARAINQDGKMKKLELRNDAESILRATVDDMASHQSSAGQASKSRGYGGGSDELDSASVVHGAGRVGSGFNIVELVSEYRALRASVLRLWRESAPEADAQDLEDITRFNESIDQSLTQALAGYAARVDQTRRMFLAILAHDLRSPLSTISLSAGMAARDDLVPTDSKDALSLIETSVQAISRLVSDLTDFAASGLGEAMPIAPAPLNLEALCLEVKGEMQAAHPSRPILFDAHGDLALSADGSRLRQVVSNLLGNAIQHGSSGSPVRLSLSGETSEIMLSVHNEGAPIPTGLLPTIFDPLVRGSVSDAPRRQGSIGLGLYIVREIVKAHGGSIVVSSTESDGTCFAVRIPRCPPEP